MIGRIRELTVDTLKAWLDDDAFHWGAAIAYYSMISLGPLIVLAVTLLGRLFGSGAVEQRVLEQVELLAGPRGVEVARTVLEQAARPEMSSVGAVLTIAILLFGATAVFVNFQNALNRIWAVQPKSGMLRNMLRTRLSAFLVVLALGALMVVSVVLGALIGWAGPLVEPIEAMLPFVKAADLVTSLILLWLFVGALYWILPDAKISPRDVWVGALVTAILLVAGKYALSAFLARNAFASMYGTAGSILLLLLWIYYSAQVFFIGAEFTQVWARKRGREIEPESYAARMEIVHRHPGEDVEAA